LRRSRRAGHDRKAGALGTHRVDSL
jgi:hypothetical protein